MFWSLAIARLHAKVKRLRRRSGDVVHETFTLTHDFAKASSLWEALKDVESAFGRHKSRLLELCHCVLTIKGSVETEELKDHI